MKSLKNDESGVSYLLLAIFGLGIVVIGICYSIISDMVDVFLNIPNQLSSGMDLDSVYGLNLLTTLFRYVLMPALLIMIYYLIVMAQKPQKDF